MNYKMLHPRDELTLTISRIYRRKMTTTSGGNLSILDENGDMWITPAGVDKGTLTPEDIVCVKADGTIEGRHRPSSEYPFHRAIYNARPDIKGIVHAHPKCTVSFSITKRLPNTRMMPNIYRWNGKVGYAEYAVPGSVELGAKIAEQFIAGFDSVVLESHGVCCGGKNLQHAFHRFETLDLCAQTEIKACLLGKPVSLTDEQLALEFDREVKLESFSHSVSEMTVKEKELRNKMCAFVSRGYQQELFTGSTGSISARVDDDSFLITPHPLDRFSMRPEDVVLVRNGKCEEGKTPSHAVTLHAAIYDANPEVNSVINANPADSLAFSVCNQVIDTRTLPECYIFLREVSLFPYEMSLTGVEQIAEKMSLRYPAAVVNNNGVIVVGQDILAAFDKLEVLEASASAIVGSISIGGHVPMGEKVIDDLVEAFNLPK